MTQLMNTLFIGIYLLMSTCSQSTISSNEISDTNKVFYNGKEILLNEADFNKLHLALTELLDKCDDFYEQIVTDQLVDNIKKTESYLEVQYSNKTEVNIGNEQSLTMQRLVIPLSGKYQSGNEITFFCGNPGYSTQPFINSEGFEKLDKVLQKLINN